MLCIFILSIPCFPLLSLSLCCCFYWYFYSLQNLLPLVFTFFTTPYSVLSSSCFLFFFQFPLFHLEIIAELVLCSPDWNRLNYNILLLYLIYWSGPIQTLPSDLKYSFFLLFFITLPPIHHNSYFILLPSSQKSACVVLDGNPNAWMPLSTSTPKKEQDFLFSSLHKSKMYHSMHLTKPSAIFHSISKMLFPVLVFTLLKWFF